jgi:hypothetical protein
MPSMSRRKAICASASVGVVAAGAIYAAGPSLSQIGSRTAAVKPTISFVAAKKEFDARLKDTIEASQTGLEVKYTPQQLDEIQRYAWSSFQEILSRHYIPQEAPPEVVDALKKEAKGHH